MSDFGKGVNAPSKDIVYRQDVEDILQNALPSRGMWEIEGDVAKNAICETVVDLMMDLEKLPSAQPEIIRCKDCRYNNDCEIQYSAQSGDEFFCGCAERRTDD